MSQGVLEKIAIVTVLGVLGLAGWFWYEQVLSVIELLQMAYG